MVDCKIMQRPYSKVERVEAIRVITLDEYCMVMVSIS